MSFRSKLIVIGICGLGFSMAAQANEVRLSAEQPLMITYQVAHKKLNGQPVFGARQSVKVGKNQSVIVPFSLDGYDRAGVVIAAFNEHELPLSANEFDKPERCSMTTDKVKTTGVLTFKLTEHTASCRTDGGVFG